MHSDPTVYHCLAYVKRDELTDDYYIEFDDKLMEELQWRPGDTIQWSDNKDGSFTLRKKEVYEV